GCVGLDKGLKLPARYDVASLGRNDSRGDGLTQAERAAHGEHPVAYLHTVRVAQLSCGQASIGLRVRANHFGIVLHIWWIVLETHTNAIRFVDDVTIREDVALGVHNDAGAKRALTDGTAVNARTTLAAEEAVEKIFHATPAVFAPRT